MLDGKSNEGVLGFCLLTMGIMMPAELFLLQLLTVPVRLGNALVLYNNIVKIMSNR